MNLEQALRTVDKKVEAAIKQNSPVLKDLSDICCLSAGKKLRARLLFSFSGNYSDEAVQTAAAIELLHMASLIHDDILDQALLRRQQPALYRLRGIPASVLYGDYLFSQSYCLMAELKNPLFFREMTRAVSQVLQGEIEEMCRRGDISLTKKEYLSIIMGKSGVLFGLACKLGMLIKNPDMKSAEKACRFGVSLGMAYQILDDCSDYLGSDKEKSKFNDIREGQITLPLIYLLAKCTKDENRSIVGILADPKADFGSFEKISFLMQRYGVISDCSQDAQSLLTAAKNNLSREVCAGTNRLLEVSKGIEDKLSLLRDACQTGRWDQENAYAGKIFVV